MERYINKATLVAEIKRRISLFKKEKKTEKWSAEASQMNVVSLGARIAMLEEILSFLNTLEVKEVDSENEIKKVQRKYKTIEEYEGYPCTMYANDIEWIAKNFFELGLKARKYE